MQENTLINKQSLKYLLGGVIFLAVANAINILLGQPFWTITRFIFLGFDNNIAAWYSSILLAVAGLLSYECSLHAKIKKVTNHWPFLIFALLLFFMSCDEIAQFHEIIGGLIAKYTGVSSKSFAQHTAWVWIGGPIVLAIFTSFIFLLRKSFSLVPQSIFPLIIGFAFIILGGVVLESTTNFLNHEELEWVWHIEVIFEETFEMVGTIFIAYSLILWRDGILK